MIVSKERVDFLMSKLKTIRSQPNFSKPKKAIEIMAEMPDFDIYLQNKAETQELGKNAEDLYKPCYVEPILSHKQQFHLFRKYNFLKVQMYRLLSGIYSVNRNKRYLEANRIYEKELTPIRHLLITSNLRLIYAPAKKYPICYRDALIEDGYESVTRCIDVFDWRLGNRFTTYAIWAIRNNHREVVFQKKKRIQARSLELSDLQISDSTLLDVGHKLEEMEDGEERLKTINAIVNSLEDEGEKTILRHVFGLQGLTPKTHKEVGELIGCGKEWVRQRMVRAIDKLRFALRGIPIPVVEKKRDRSRERKRKVA